MAKPRAGKRKREVRWGPTYQNMALRTLVAAFNWAKGQELISAHCLENPKAVQVGGRKRSRGQEAYVPPATWKKLIERVDKTNHGFADVLRFLYSTGCRPSEAFHVEARYYHRADRCVVYPGHPGPDDFAWKNARRTGKDRVIFLPDDVAKTVEARIAKHPTGPIFLTNRGTPWASLNVSVNIR